MKQPAIHQFHSGSAFGDAVTNSLLYTKKILNDLGFESNIYVEHVAPELKEEILHFSNLKSNENNIILLHHSMGHDLDEWILGLKEKIVLIYHNITPAEFFPKESLFRHYSLKGREQLHMFKKLSVGAIGDSRLNADELIEVNFDAKCTKVIPLLIDYDKIINHAWNYSLFDKNSETFNVLFVGRIAENKGQIELIETFKIFLEMYDFPARLYLVGGTSGDAYEEKIRNLISSYSLDEQVILTGKVSHEDLYAYYHLADAFVCLSEHEGFGVPLIEAMIFDIPVIAYDSSSIKNTLGDSGVLFKEKNLEYMAGFISLLAKNRALRREIIKKQRDNLLKFQYNNIKSELASFLNSLNLTKIDLSTLKQTTSINHTTIQIEGPFDSTYSLALLNREMSKALNEKLPNEVALFSTEGLGDYEPNVEFLRDNPLFDAMYLKSKKANTADVVLRNLYPPRVHDAKGLINLTNSYGWEESSFPQEYLNDFNRYLDALPVMSKYVKKVMIDNGLSIPSTVVGVGADHILSVKAKKLNIKTKKTFKFLHISSCFPRKGVDVLLKAYFTTFTKDDDVCLIIKTFPNPHNNVERQIEEYKEKNINYPEVELINEDVEDGCIVHLYKTSDCLVAPSRGEGYGLPMAEAMLFDLPVITTGYGGQTDFCSNETSWLIDYSFNKAKTHMNLFNSYWAEPKWEHLASLMKDLSTMPKENIANKTTQAKKNILANHKWEDCASRMLEAVNHVEKQSIFKNQEIKLGWISTWNTKCGIATYSEHLINGMYKDVTILANHTDQLTAQDNENVHRCWSPGEEDNLVDLTNTIDRLALDTIVIQFNYGFFNFDKLNEFIDTQVRENRTIVVMLHATKDPTHVTYKHLEKLVSSFKKCDRLLVHSPGDLNRLKNYGLLENVALFPHGILDWFSPNDQQVNDTFTIASYGFFLPHKGLLELIEATSILIQKGTKVQLKMINAQYPIPESENLVQEAKGKINVLGLSSHVELNTDFLPDNESLLQLSEADLIVFPYQETGESSSAAVRYGLATEKPIAVTPLAIFDDVDRAVFKLPGTTVEKIAEGIENLMHEITQNTKAIRRNKSDADKWRAAHRYSNLGTRLTSILIALENQ